MKDKRKSLSTLTLLLQEKWREFSVLPTDRIVLIKVQISNYIRVTIPTIHPSWRTPLCMSLLIRSYVYVERTDLAKVPKVCQNQNRIGRLIFMAEGFNEPCNLSRLVSCSLSLFLLEVVVSYYLCVQKPKARRLCLPIYVCG